MARSKNQFLRFQIIDKALRENNWVKSSRLKELVDDYLKEDVSLRTIQKDIDAMKNDSRLKYDAPIVFDSRRKAFGYSDKEYSIMNFALGKDEINALKFYASCLKIYSEYSLFKDFSNAIQKIVDGVSIKNKLRKHTDPDLIVQTDTLLNLQGSDFLPLIVQAIDETMVIEFDYQKYSDEEKKSRRFYPYLLKEYRNRWYVLGILEGKTFINTFALDRMSNFKLLADKFEKNIPFDHANYFKHSFGITTPDAKVQKIILEFTNTEAPYIKSLPVHPTQKKVRETKEYLRISIEVIPSYELYEYILSKTPDVKVISPQSIAKEIQQKLKLGLEKIS